MMRSIPPGGGGGKDNKTRRGLYYSIELNRGAGEIDKHEVECGQGLSQKEEGFENVHIVVSVSGKVADLKSSFSGKQGPETGGETKKREEGT